MGIRDVRGADSEADNQKSVSATDGLKTAAAGSEITVQLDINGLSEDVSPSATDDFTLVFDTSAGVHKKVKLQNVPAGATGSSVAANAIYIDTVGSYTYNKSAGVRAVYVSCIGGGAGGGGATKAATNATGGTGGGGGGFSEAWFDGEDLAGSVSCSIGDGGAGSPGATTDNTTAAAASGGGDTNFGSWLQAKGGLAGLSSSTNLNRGGGSGGQGVRDGGSGGTADDGAIDTNAPNVDYAGAGGGAGAGKATSTLRTAGVGGWVFWCESSGAAAGVSSATVPTSGADGVSRSGGPPGGGGGGGGSTNGVGISGGNGGNGGTPGGAGGGGGACGNGVGSQAGSGGNGGKGSILIVEFF